MIPALPPHLSIILAQTSTDLSQGFGTGLTIILMVAFLLAVVGIVSGAMDIHRGNFEQGKAKIIAAIITAAAVAIVTILFTTFGLNKAIIRPQ